MSPATLSLRRARKPSPDDIHCPQCHKLIFDGEVLLARVTRFPVNAPAEAMCKICKTWVKVPVVISGGDHPCAPASSSRPASG